MAMLLTYLNKWSAVQYTEELELEHFIQLLGAHSLILLPQNEKIW